MLVRQAARQRDHLRLGREHVEPAGDELLGIERLAHTARDTLEEPRPVEPARLVELEADERSPGPQVPQIAARRGQVLDEASVAELH
jgi:hypothetical protein